MDNFLLSAEVVLPLFLMMALGYLLRRILELDDRWIELTNKIIFRALLPLLLFRNMYESDLSGMSAPGMAGLVFLCIGALIVTFLALNMLVPRLEKENSRRGVLIQGAFRGNAAIFGIPIATLLFGENNISAVVLLLACIVPLLNVCSVISLERFRFEKTDWRHIFYQIATNPLIIGILLGIVLNALHVKLPSPLKSAAWSLANSTTPVSFLALGASFTFASAAKNRRELTGIVLFKLAVLPLIWVGLAGLLGYRGQQLTGVLLVFGPPAAVSSFPMACAMGGDTQLSSEIVVFTSIFSILTMFLWIFGLKSLGWI